MNSSQARALSKVTLRNMAALMRVYGVRPQSTEHKNGASDNPTIEQLLERMNHYKQQKNFIEASKNYLAAMQKQPENTDPWLLLMLSDEANTQLLSKRDLQGIATLYKQFSDLINLILKHPERISDQKKLAHLYYVRCALSIGTKERLKGYEGDWNKLIIDNSFTKESKVKAMAANMTTPESNDLALSAQNLRDLDEAIRLVPEDEAIYYYGRATIRHTPFNDYKRTITDCNEAFRICLRTTPYSWIFINNIQQLKRNAEILLAHQKSETSATSSNATANAPTKLPSPKP